MAGPDPGGVSEDEDLRAHQLAALAGELAAALDTAVDEVRTVRAGLDGAHESDEREIDRLEKRFDVDRRRLLSLTVGAVVTVVVLWTIWLGIDDAGTWLGHLVLLSTSVAAGVAGSAVAALTSLLDRHAGGFELADGRKAPVSEKKDRFSMRMAPWFTARPVVGGFAGLVAFAGGAVLVGASSADPPPDDVVFVALLAGLFAKSLIERLKAIFDAIIGA